MDLMVSQQPIIKLRKPAIINTLNSKADSFKICPTQPFCTYYQQKEINAVTLHQLTREKEGIKLFTLFSAKYQLLSNATEIIPSQFSFPIHFTRTPYHSIFLSLFHHTSLTSGFSSPVSRKPIFRYFHSLFPNFNGLCCSAVLRIPFKTTKNKPSSMHRLPEDKFLHCSNNQTSNL